MTFPPQGGQSTGASRPEEPPRKNARLPPRSPPAPDWRRFRDLGSGDWERRGKSERAAARALLPRRTLFSSQFSLKQPTWFLGLSKIRELDKILVGNSAKVGCRGGRYGTQSHRLSFWNLRSDAVMIRAAESGRTMRRNPTLLIRDRMPEDRLVFDRLFDTCVIILWHLPHFMSGDFKFFMQCLVWACRACKRRAVSLK